MWNKFWFIISSKNSFLISFILFSTWIWIFAWILFKTPNNNRFYFCVNVFVTSIICCQFPWKCVPLIVLHFIKIQLLQLNFILISAKCCPIPMWICFDWFGLISQIHLSVQLQSFNLCVFVCVYSNGQLMIRNSRSRSAEKKNRQRVVSIMAPNKKCGMTLTPFGNIQFNQLIGSIDLGAMCRMPYVIESRPNVNGQMTPATRCCCNRK